MIPELLAQLFTDPSFGEDAATNNLPNRAFRGVIFIVVQIMVIAVALIISFFVVLYTRSALRRFLEQWRRGLWRREYKAALTDSLKASGYLVLIVLGHLWIAGITIGFLNLSYDGITHPDVPTLLKIPIGIFGLASLGGLVVVLRYIQDRTPFFTRKAITQQEFNQILQDKTDRFAEKHKRPHTQEEFNRIYRHMLRTYKTPI